MKTTTLKIAILNLFFFFITTTNFAQTTYTYTGTGSWTDTANWAPSYPGTTINSGDAVEIQGTLNNSSSVENNGIITIQNNASFNNSGTFTNNNTVYNYWIINNDKDILNNGSISGGGDFLITANGVLENNGTYDGTGYKENKGTINNNNLIINASGFFINDGVFLNTNAAILNVSNDGRFSNNNILTNNGILFVGGTFENNLNLINNKTIENRSFYFFNEGTITNNSAAEIQNINFARIKNDAIINNIGTIKNESGAVLDNNASINNTGILINNANLTGVNIMHTNTFSNLGTINPGVYVWNFPDTGTYTFNDSYVHESSATLGIDIKNTSDFDKILVNNTATLNGTLNVSFLNGYTPNGGETFTIITANTISGTFTSVNFPNNLNWDILYTPSTVVIGEAAVLNILKTNRINFKMYPNPTKNQLTIQLQNTTILKSVSIYNTLGKKIITSTSNTINTSNLSTGLYTVTVLTNLGKTSKKLVIE